MHAVLTTDSTCCTAARRPPLPLPTAARRLPPPLSSPSAAPLLPVRVPRGLAARLERESHGVRQVEDTGAFQKSGEGM